MRMIGFAALAALFLAQPVLAQDQPKDQAQDPPKQTTVESDEMEIIDAENKTIFRGNVVAVRNDATIHCDQLVVNNEDVKQPDGTTKSQVKVMNATGNVNIKTEKETITALRADIYEQDDRLEAFDNVTLVQGTNTVHGDKLISNLKTKRTVVSSGGKAKVKGSFVPR